ncbi:MAG: PIN domain-containing protein [Planctomycetia bacterium]
MEARSIDVDHRVAIEAYKLPGRFHKDPADRMLVATARINDLTLVTADERILAYREVRSLDARR